MFSNLPVIILDVKKTNVMLEMHFKDNQNIQKYSLYPRNPPWPFEAVAYITVVCYHNMAGALQSRDLMLCFNTVIWIKNSLLHRSRDIYR
jgi:hypothetical protein